MNVDGDESFEFYPIYLCQVSRRLVDECIQEFEETIIVFSHNLLVGASLHESQLSVPGPNHLYSQ